MIGLTIDSNGHSVPFKNLRDFGKGVAIANETDCGDNYYVILVDKDEPFSSFLKEIDASDFSVSLLHDMLYVVNEGSEFYYMYRLYDGRHNDFLSQLSREKKVMFCIVDKDLEVEVSFVHDIII